MDASDMFNARHVLPSFIERLAAFNESPQKFRLIYSLLSQGNITRRPSTLFILDSSFNPPTRAHLSLAASALERAEGQYPAPHRLLLLLGTSNAEKAPQPAAFEQRLVMMAQMAHDLLNQSEKARAINIDIGLAKAPYYVDKSAAISQAVRDGECVEYDSETKHVHILGFDNLIRFLTPKYYQNFDPPLSALNSFFESGHGLLCTHREVSVSKDDTEESQNDVQAQKQYLEGLRNGQLAERGFQSHWVNSISLVSAELAAEGISSTLAREATKRRDWDALAKLCTETITKWIKEESLYNDGD